jgi:hypothetical protein
MTAAGVDQIIRSVLYGGYVFGLARPSALSHGHASRGVVLPPGVGDGAASQIETQCLVRAPGTTPLDVQVRFLHLATRHEDGLVWDEAAERVVRLQVSLADGCARPIRESFRWPGFRTADRIQESLRGDVELLVEPVGPDPAFFKVTVVLANTTSTPLAGVDRTSALRFSLVSAHVLLEAPRGRFVSLLDPSDGPEAEAARACRQVGLWPVLVGEPGVGAAMLAAPIVLSDYPEVAPTGPLDGYDATAIDDEVLVLRVLSLTDDEKREMRCGDLRARRLLERAERQRGVDRLVLPSAPSSSVARHEECRP